MYLLMFIEGDFDSYVSQIRKTRVWGGEPELLMASHVLKMPIRVYMNNDKEVSGGGLISIAEFGHEYSKEDAIKVLFHGFGHYDALHIPGLLLTSLQNNNINVPLTNNTFNPSVSELAFDMVASGRLSSDKDLFAAEFYRKKLPQSANDDDEKERVIIVEEEKVKKGEEGSVLVGELKISEVDVAGVKSEGETCKKKKTTIWGGSNGKQQLQQARSRWFVANGMGKNTTKHPLMKSKGCGAGLRSISSSKVNGSSSSVVVKEEDTPPVPPVVVRVNQVRRRRRRYGVVQR
ncbi:uncharacterized protein [Rutidosis leptorrhynchoides]|uniref:uncharacterized protein n=1 Tax=Rutidosis leptorrhynchoides TaxID=125765 RepID=UPI003A99D0FF